MSSGIIGMQCVHCFLLAYVTIRESFHVIRDYWNAVFALVFTSMWESCYVIRDYWNAVFALVFTSICNDVGVISCHPGLLECSVCIGLC